MTNPASNSLFRFRFSGKLDWRSAEVLRQASGMRISLTESYMREPGQGEIGDAVFIWLSAGTDPNTWEIGAETYDRLCAVGFLKTIGVFRRSDVVDGSRG